MSLADVFRALAHGARGSHRCECGLAVKRRLELCERCATSASHLVRRMSLSRAWASLPAWEHSDNLGTVLAPELARAAKLWHPSSGNLLMCGPSGQGKTTSAIHIARRMLRAAEDHGTLPAARELAAGIRFVSARHIAAEMTTHLVVSSAARSRESTPEVMRVAIRARLLILDELGKEQDDRHQAVARVIQDRYDARDDGKRRLTISTSELTPEGIEERYGAAVVRRLGHNDPAIGESIVVGERRAVARDRKGRE